MSYWRVPAIGEQDPRVWDRVSVRVIIENQPDKAHLSVFPGELPTWGDLLRANPEHVFHSCHDPWNYIEEMGGRPEETTPLFALGRWIRLAARSEGSPAKPLEG
jgi:hypothetical protein